MSQKPKQLEIPSMGDQRNGRTTRSPLSPGEITASDLTAPSNSYGASDNAGPPSQPMSTVDPIKEHIEAFTRPLVERLDEVRSQDWSVAADGIMVFTGLFSATVASFLTVSYPNLSPDSDARTVVLLGWISQQLAEMSNGTARAFPFPIPSGSDVFTSGPSWSAIVVNALWSASLSTTLTCALLATLVKRWTQRRIQDVSLQWRPFMLFVNDDHVSLLTGAVLPLMVHLSIVLFFVGFVIFLFEADHTVSWPLLGALAFCSVVYFFFVFSSFRSRSR